MRYTFQVSMVFSLSGNVIEFLFGRKVNELKQKKIPPAKHDNGEPALVK